MNSTSRIKWKPGTCEFPVSYDAGAKSTYVSVFEEWETGNWYRNSGSLIYTTLLKRPRLRYEESHLHYGLFLKRGRKI